MEKTISKVAEELLAGINNQSSITVYSCEGENDGRIIFVKTAIDLPRLIFEVEIESQGTDGTISGKITEISLIDADGEALEAHLSKWHLNSKVIISFAALQCEGGTMVR